MAPEHYLDFEVWKPVGFGNDLILVPNYAAWCHGLPLGHVQLALCVCLMWMFLLYSMLVGA